LLSGENGHGRLKNLEQKLRMRQQYMIRQVAYVYPVRSLDEQSPAVKRGLTSNVSTTSMPFSTQGFTCSSMLLL
jgi:UV radiation resistance-associated gene protein